MLCISNLANQTLYHTITPTSLHDTRSHLTPTKHKLPPRTSCPQPRKCSPLPDHHISKPTRYLELRSKSQSLHIFFFLSVHVRRCRVYPPSHCQQQLRPYSQSRTIIQNKKISGCRVASPARPQKCICHCFECSCVSLPCLFIVAMAGLNICSQSHLCVIVRLSKA